MTMGYQRRTLFVLSSCALAVLLISTAYVSSGPSFLSTKSAGAESTHDLLVSYASKDTDSDGLPDWQEALYGTDPQNAHSVNAAVTDGEAVAQGLVQPKFKTATTTPVDSSVIPGATAGPETITDQFSKSLFGQYFLARAKGKPSSAEVATFVQQGVADLKKNQVVPNAFNQGQVKVSDTGPDALLVYAATAEKALAKSDTGRDRSEIEYFADYVNKDDKTALAEVKKYGTAYAAAGHALIKIPVPKELSNSHLKLANALMQLSESTLDMASMAADPLRAMLGMATYTDSAAALAEALGEMNAVYKTEHVIPTAGTTGSSFYNATLAGVKK